MSFSSVRLPEAEAGGVIHVLDAVFREFECVLIGVRIQMAVSPFVVICCLVYAIPRRFSTRSGEQGGSLNRKYKCLTFDKSVL